MSEDKRWIVAAKTLRQDPKKEVLCPKCQTGMLEVSDVAVKKKKLIDRYMVCNIVAQ